MKNLWLVAILGGVLFLSGLLAVKEHRTEIFRDESVIVEKGIRFFDRINVHGIKPRYLKIAGKEFKGIRGAAPYYIKIPEINGILFVTDVNDSVRFHIVRLETLEIIDIEGRGSGFGANIGGPGKPGDSMTDYIESVKDNLVILVENTGSWKALTSLNLRTRTVEKVEVLHFDKDGNLKKQILLK